MGIRELVPFQQTSEREEGKYFAKKKKNAYNNGIENLYTYIDL